MARLEPSGGTTPIFDSIAAVLSRDTSDADGRVIVITDGVKECEADPVGAMAALNARSADTIELSLVGFELNTGAERTQLVAIADAGGGAIVDARGSEAFATALRMAFSSNSKW